MRVAILVVAHNSALEIGACLDALRGLDGIECVVVDNASIDDTRTEVTRRDVRLIANPNNAGFAAAVNQGVRATIAKLILLLNPDARLCGGLEALVAHFEDPNTGAAGGMLIDGSGFPQRGFMARNLPSPSSLVFEVLGINRLWPGNPVNRHYRCFGMNAAAPADIEQPAGAFLMFSRAAWANLGGFDESFWPIWFEDVDFCARLKASGYAVKYEPLAVAKHTGAHSIKAVPLETREQYWYVSLLKYAAKHYRFLAFRTICLAVVVGAGVKMIRGFYRQGPKAYEVYGSIIRFALGRLFSARRDSRMPAV